MSGIKYSETRFSAIAITLFSLLNPGLLELEK
jgi:hypothetical protein